MNKREKIIRIRRGWRFILFVVIVMMCVSWEAMAKPKSAKALTSEGARAFEKEDFEGALVKFQEAYALEPSSSLLYNMGRVCERKGDFNAAMGHYRQFVTSPDADEEARVDALKRIETIEKIITINNGGMLTGSAAPAANKHGSMATAATGNSQNARPKGQVKAAAAAGGSGCVDINTADEEGLDSLPGIGPAKVKLIMSMRASKGGFHSLSELGEVKGIGDKTLAKLKPYICAPIGSGGGAMVPAVAAPSMPPAAPPTPAPPKVSQSKAPQASANKSGSKVIDL